MYFYHRHPSTRTLTLYMQIMYGVLYAVSPEIFPAKDRGTGNGLTATATRVFGVIVRLSLLHAFQHTLIGT